MIGELAALYAYSPVASLGNERDPRIHFSRRCHSDLGRVEGRNAGLQQQLLERDPSTPKRRFKKRIAFLRPALYIASGLESFCDWSATV